MKKTYKLDIQTGDLNECDKSNILVNEIFIIAEIEDNDIKNISIKHACGNSYYDEVKNEWTVDCKPLFLL